MSPLTTRLAGPALVVAALAFPAAASADQPKCHGHRATIVGTNHGDTIVGTNHRDVIVGAGPTGAASVRGQVPRA